jgi:hypothetical protein
LSGLQVDWRGLALHRGAIREAIRWRIADGPGKLIDTFAGARGSSGLSDGAQHDGDRKSR